MAEQTTSSIVVDARAGRRHGRHRRLRRLPRVGQGRHEAAEVVHGEPDGWAEQVFFRLDCRPIKDEYTLAYEWDGYDEVTWTLVEGKMLRALDGAYVLRDLGDGRPR